MIVGWVFLFGLMGLQNTAQTPGDEPENEARISFEPLYPGNQIQIGEFKLTVPDGFFFADEGNAHHMYRLAGADYIPNCVGIFFSNQANWDFAIVAQYYQGKNLVLAPEATDELVSGQFAGHHLYYMRPVQGDFKMVIPPTLDLERGSFVVGVSYDNTENAENSGVFIKKIWIRNGNAMIFSLGSTSIGYDRNAKEILTAFDALEIVADPAPAPGDQPQVSYLELLGLSPQFVPIEEQPSYMVFSLFAAVFGILLLVVALRIKKAREMAAGAQ